MINSPTYNADRLATYTERFWDKVEVTGDDSCWKWRGSRQAGGYGSLNVTLLRLVTSKGNPKTVISSHCFSYVIHSGIAFSDLLGKEVCHTCDNPECCNPKHLYLGTSSTNRQDCLTRGRHKTNGNDKKTHCPRGHAYDESNTYRDSWGRHCLACKKLHEKTEHYKKMKAASTRKRRLRAKEQQ